MARSHDIHWGGDAVSGVRVLRFKDGLAWQVDCTAANIPSSKTGYCKGCFLVATDTGKWYRNTGSSTSCTFTEQAALDVDLSTLTATAAELNVLHSVTAGTVSASKGLVVDSSSALDAVTVTTLTSPTIAGTTAHTGRVTTTDGVASGTAKVVGGLAYSNVAASSAVTSTATETAFDTNYTLPANTLKAGTVVKVRFQGILSATTNTDTFRFALYIGGTGGTALVPQTTATDATNNDVFQGEYTVICRTAGSSGTMVGCGSYKSINAAEGTMTIKDDILASTSINTQTTQQICVSGKWSTADVNNSARLDVIAVEVY